MRRGCLETENQDEENTLELKQGWRISAYISISDNMYLSLIFSLTLYPPSTLHLGRFRLSPEPQPVWSEEKKKQLNVSQSFSEKFNFLQLLNFVLLSGEKTLPAALQKTAHILTALQLPAIELHVNMSWRSRRKAELIFWGNLQNNRIDR